MDAKLDVVGDEAGLSVVSTMGAKILVRVGEVSVVVDDTVVVGLVEKVG